MADEYELNDPAKAAAANPVTDTAWLFGALEGTVDPQPELQGGTGAFRLVAEQFAIIDHSKIEWEQWHPGGICLPRSRHPHRCRDSEILGNAAFHMVTQKQGNDKTSTSII